MTATQKPTTIYQNDRTFTIRPYRGRWGLFEGETLLSKSRSADKLIAEVQSIEPTKPVVQPEYPIRRATQTYNQVGNKFGRSNDPVTKAEKAKVQEKVKTEPKNDSPTPTKAEMTAILSEQPTVEPNTETTVQPKDYVAHAQTGVHANGSAFTSKRPGVLAVMVKMLTEASETNPVTKQQILDRLTTTFTDRDSGKMKATLSMQMPAGLRYEKKIVLASKPTEQGKGYWIDTEATEKLKKV